MNFKGTYGQPYRPATGAEGEIFRARYCDQCSKDVSEQCGILNRALAFIITDAFYPKEWIYGEDGEPTCTALATIVEQLHT